MDALFSEGLYVVSPSPTIILDQPWEHITPAEKKLLEKILTAIRQSLDSVSIKYQDSLDLSTWNQKPKHVVYFGKPIKGVPLYETVEADGVIIVASENLSYLSTNEDARKTLAGFKKTIFSLILH